LTTPRTSRPRFFDSAADFRAWLEEHHRKSPELLLGFHKTSSAKKGITYQEALDEALCFGWIDGVRRSLDDTRYTIRFTPRKPRSNWSLVNIKRVRELITAGRMTATGLDVFEQRDERKSQLYSYEPRSRPLDAVCERRFKAKRKAWSFFQSQAPWYRRTTSWWVMSAKKEATRLRRLAALIECCEKGERVPVLG
jgi:uncharacterized protein YdeI (YjbR/CyaY-like superfamily)